MNLQLTNIYKRSFGLFCHDIVNQKVGKMHTEIINQLENGNQHLAVMASRGHFKTYVMSRSFPLWVIYKEKTPKDIIICSMNQTQSRRILGIIRDEIKKNPNFKHFRFKMDSADKIQVYIPGTLDFHTVVSIPLGTRGEHGDYVISDDVMKDDEGRTSSSMRKLKDTWWKAQFPMAMARGSSFGVDENASEKQRSSGKHLFIGTPIAYDDMFMDLKDLAETKKTWKFMRYPALKEDGSPQFPEHYSLQTLQDIKDSTTSWAWEQEYMLNPIGSDDAIFSIDMLERAAELPCDDLTPEEELYREYYIGCDVAMSSKNSSDYSAFVIVSKDLNGVIRLEYIWHEQGVSEDEQIIEIQRLCHQYKITGGRIERKGLTESMANKVVSAPGLSGIMEDWIPTNARKEVIIGNVQLLMKHNMLALPRDVKHQEELIKELGTFGVVNHNGTQTMRAMSGHDDLVIGTSLAVAAAGGWAFEEANRPTIEAL